MSDIFSHSQPDRIRSVARADRGRPDAVDIGAAAPEAITAVVVVPVDRQKAWEGFTEYLHLWWPLEHTHFGSGTHAELNGSAMGEENEAGERHQWAEVVQMNDLQDLELAWTLGWESSSPSDVRINFEEDQDGTKVTVVHQGWGTGAEAAEHARSFEGWPEALTAYARFMGSSPSGESI